MADSCYNIAIIGQTGVGKSSLLNYLFNFDENSGDGAKTGIGRPVTKNGFHQFDVHIKGNRASVYDSWGLEVGKEAEWMRELDQELKKRGVEKAPEDWFHSVFYCVAAAGARIQDADIKIIKKLIDQKYQVSIILTKTDCLSEDEEKDFISVIQSAFDHNISVTPVCSVSKKTRTAEIKPFGKEEVHRQSFINLVDSLIERVPAHCAHEMSKHLNQWRDKMHLLADGIGFLGTNKDTVDEKVKEHISLVQGEIQTVCADAMKNCLSNYQSVAEFMQRQLTIHERESSSAGKDNLNSSRKINWAYAFAFAPLAAAFTPIVAVAALSGLGSLIAVAQRWQRGSSLSEIKSSIDTICMEIQANIQKQVDSIRGSLESLKMQSDSIF